jgi:HCO3- transporter family
MPAIAYTLDMSRRTEGAYGINESILASALAAIVFPIFSCQPLTIVRLCFIGHLLLGLLANVIDVV